MAEDDASRIEEVPPPLLLVSSAGLSGKNQRSRILPSLRFVVFRRLRIAHDDLALTVFAAASAQQKVSAACFSAFKTMMSSQVGSEDIAGR
jgi:hypothetical protein